MAPGAGGVLPGIPGGPPLSVSRFPPQGVGRRYAHVVLRKADIDLTKRAGELTEDEVRRAGELWGVWILGRGRMKPGWGGESLEWLEPLGEQGNPGPQRSLWRQNSHHEWRGGSCRDWVTSWVLLRFYPQPFFLEPQNKALSLPWKPRQKLFRPRPFRTASGWLSSRPRECPWEAVPLWGTGSLPAGGVSGPKWRPADLLAGAPPSAPSAP